MTKEEIIDFCEMKSQLEPENEDIFNYIIKALSLVPCDDAISRQAVLNTLFYKSDNNSEVRLSKELRDRIKNLPSVNLQEPKTAHWIDDKCSICGKGIENLIDSREWYKNVTPNYCPFCGARVIESE